MGCCFAAAGLGVVLLVHTVTFPPQTRARNIDEQAREDVEWALIDTYNAVRDMPPHQLNDALRWVGTPYNLSARVFRPNNFRLEDIGPMSNTKGIWKRTGEKLPSLAPFIGCKAETRVLLYFPDGATKATAIFVAVNVALKLPTKKDVKAEMKSFKPINRALFEVSLLETDWVSEHKIWARSHPALVGSIEELEQIPVIFNYRAKAYGSMRREIIGVNPRDGM